MLRVSSTEVQNNFGKYLMLAQERDVIVTRNGQDVARLSSLSVRKGGTSITSEEVFAEGYGLRKATYEEFLELTKDSEARYEYIDGEIFLQASPKTDHQLALSELHVFFHSFLAGSTCRPMLAPYDITIRRQANDINVVQPDLMVICDLEEHLGEDGYYHGVPTLVVEILSEGTRRNDLIKKLNLYMRGGIREYWTVDPKNKQIAVYTFANQDIQEHVVYTVPREAESLQFPGLTVDLQKVFLSL